MAITDEALRELFAKLDTDKSGKLEIPELKELLIQIDGNASDDRITKLLEEAKAVDNVITCDQFITAFRAANTEAPSAEAPAPAAPAGEAPAPLQKKPSKLFGKKKMGKLLMGAHRSGTLEAHVDKMEAALGDAPAPAPSTLEAPVPGA